MISAAGVAIVGIAWAVGRHISGGNEDEDDIEARRWSDLGDVANASGRKSSSATNMTKALTRSCQHKVSEGSQHAEEASKKGDIVTEAIIYEDRDEVCSGPVRGWHQYIELKTKRGDCVRTEKFGDGKVVWCWNPKDASHPVTGYFEAFRWYEYVSEGFWTSEMCKSMGFRDAMAVSRTKVTSGVTIADLRAREQELWRGHYSIFWDNCRDFTQDLHGCLCGNV